MGGCAKNSAFDLSIEPPGKRDFATLLLLATYGLGAAEVLALRLCDVDWQGGTLTVRRPKTVSVELPLLPGIAKALTAYLRFERPPARSTDVIVLRRNMPYNPITSGAIRHRIRYYARLAGISARVLGTHVLRHYATSRTMPRPSRHSRSAGDWRRFMWHSPGVRTASWESDKPTLHFAAPG